MVDNLGINWEGVKYFGIFTMGYGWAHLNDAPIKALLWMGMGICVAITATKIKNWKY